MTEFTYCPQCKSPLIAGADGYLHCGAVNCSFVHYQNPTPVVAAIIEYGDQQLLLGHNKAWPPKWYGLITGFLEKYEHPDDCVLREIKEEVGLDGEIIDFIGHYTFQRMNQLIIAYHIRTVEHEIILNDEIDDYRIIPFHKAKYWPAGTGYALRDFLISKGYKPTELILN